MIKKNYRLLVWPFLTLIVLAVPAFFLEDLIKNLGSNIIEKSILIFKYGIGIGLWLSVAWLLIRLLEVFLWQGLVAPRLGGKVPRLLKDVLATIIILIAITGIVGGVFNLPVTGLWATSGAVGIILGLALQSMIADVFSGIAINIDSPYRIDEWIRVDRRGLTPIVGRVMEITWRSTRIFDKDNIVHVIPNGQMSAMIVTNLSRPQELSRFELFFCLDFGVPSERAIRIMTAAVLSAKGITTIKKPSVRVNKVTPWGVEYKVRYWLEPDKVSPPKGRNFVAGNILYHLHQAGLTLAYQKQDLYVSPMPERQLDSHSDSRKLLSRIDLFETLKDSEIEYLSNNLESKYFKSGKTIVEKGEESFSMFIVVEGLLSVFSSPDDEPEKEIKVGEIVPGQFFGEMSLLTGEKRSATVSAATDAVVYEITKEQMTYVLSNRPEVAERITRVVAERKMKNEHKMRPIPPEKQEEVTENFANRILDRMFGFFGLFGNEKGSEKDVS